MIWHSNTWRNRVLVILVAGVCGMALGPMGLVGQDPMPVVPPPDDEIEALQFMVGEWDVVTFEPTPSGEWEPGPVTRSSITQVMHFRALQEETSVHGPSIRFVYMTLWSYDPFREVYRAATIDDQEGLLDIYEGVEENGRFVLTNERAETWFVSLDDEASKFRMEIEPVNPDRIMIHVFAANPDSDEWRPRVRMEYTRTSN